MLNIGPQELFIILVIALLVVGPQRLPALGRSIGRGLRELRKAQDEVKRTIQVNLDDEPSNGSSATPAPARGAATGSADGRATDPKPGDRARPDAHRLRTAAGGRDPGHLPFARSKPGRAPAREGGGPAFVPDRRRSDDEAGHLEAAATRDAGVPTAGRRHGTVGGAGRGDAAPTPEPSPDGGSATSDRATD